MLSTPRITTNKKSRARCSGLLVVLAVVLAGCAPTGPGLLRDGERLIQQGKFPAAVAKLEAARNLLPQTALVWNYLGLAYHGAGRPTEAIQAYTQALKLNRDLYAARYNLGCLHLEQGNLPAAVNELTTFTSMQPGAADGWLKLAAAQFREKKLEAADRSLVHGLKLRPDDPAGLNTAGLIRLSRRQPRDAVAYFEDALKYQPVFPPALLNLAVTHHQHLGNRAVALEKYRNYLALQPHRENWDAVNQLAQQLDRELNPPAKPAPPAPPPARIVPPPTNASVRANLAKTSPSSTNRPSAVTFPPKSMPVASNVVRSAPPPPVVTQKVEVVRLVPDEPVKPAKEVAVVPPPKSKPSPVSPPNPLPPPAPSEPNLAAKTATPEPVSSKRPGLLQRLNPVRWFSGSATNKAQPKPTPVKVTPRPKSGASARIEPAAVSPPVINPGDGPGDTSSVSVSDAASLLRYEYIRPPVPAPGNRAEAERFFVRGVKAQREGRLMPAVTEYLTAVQADASFFDAYYNLGLAAFELGYLSRSLSAYEHALSIKPTHLDARFNFALALQKANYPRDAANELEKLLAEHPDETRTHLTLANLFAQQLGQPALAREHYLRVLQLDPRHPQAGAIRSWISNHP